MHPEGRKECERFHALAERFYDNPSFNIMPFHVFLDLYGFSQDFRDIYLSPILVILFLGIQVVYRMPARLIFNMFAGFNKQADLLTAQPCFCIKGGTNTWIQKFADVIGRDRIRTDTPVREVKRVVGLDGQNKVLVRTDSDGGDRMEVYDHVIMSCGGRAASLILGKDKNRLEEFVFSQIRYDNAHTMALHTDASFITDVTKTPDKVRNFNIRVVGTGESADMELSGYFDKLIPQEKTSPRPVVTCSPLRQPMSEKKIIHQHYCTIHQEDLYHLAITRVLLPLIQGRGNVWYGATWTNWTGHASGIDAGMCVATRLGANYIIESEAAREIYFKMCCEDMFGPRFDWRTSVRPRAKL